MADEAPATAPLAITTEVLVKLDYITNAIVGAVEGGSNYWLRSIEYTTTPEGEYENPRYSDAHFWNDGGRAKLSFDDPDSGEEDGAQIEKEVGVEEFKAGLAIMAAKHASHFGDLMAENDDAITHDVFIQCVLLGDVVYG